MAHRRPNPTLRQTGTVNAVFAANQGTHMNWDTIEGNWKQLAGQTKAQWGKLTGDDLREIAGRRDQLAGKIQERYGIAKEEAERQLEEWAAKAEDSWLG
jgi:uncharacterized protein YjbJ (UPF0337 family)